jgi:hypothetical protein
MVTHTCTDAEPAAKVARYNLDVVVLIAGNDHIQVLARCKDAWEYPTRLGVPAIRGLRPSSSGAAGG